MQIQILIVITSLALLSGCGGEGGGTAASSVKEIPIPDQSSIAPSKTEEGGLQAGAAVPDLVTGETVYRGTCSICHKSGLKGAPRLGFKEDWGSRLGQDREILYDHAINGFRGKKGYMPSRGSNSRLSKEEVKAAVDYMVVHAVPSWSVGN